MRKFCIAAAAAFVLMTGTAQAKIPVLDLGDICPALMIQVDHGRVNGFSHFDCQTGYFVGVVGKVDDERSVIASIQMNGSSWPFLIKISYPFVNGGTWSLYYTKDGYRRKLYQHGTYKVIK